MSFILIFKLNAAFVQFAISIQIQKLAKCTMCTVMHLMHYRIVLREETIYCKAESEDKKQVLAFNEGKSVNGYNEAQET